MVGCAVIVFVVFLSVGFGLCRGGLCWIVFGCGVVTSVGVWVVCGVVTVHGWFSCSWGRGGWILGWYLCLVFGCGVVFVYSLSGLRVFLSRCVLAFVILFFFFSDGLVCFSWLLLGGWIGIVLVFWFVCFFFGMVFFFVLLLVSFGCLCW